LCMQRNAVRTPRLRKNNMIEKKLELGVQPLDKVMEELELKNHDLVAASTEGLTHKQVQKGRKGRRLTRNVQDKIVDALSASADKTYVRTDLFNYK